MTNSSANERQTRHTKAIKLAEDAIRSLTPQTACSQYRQRYHFMPPAGWINDPNGLIYFRGAYHIFYQFNPYSPEWSTMHWGHACSEDLFHWTHLPVALAPSEPYDSYEKGGCFSGTSIEHDGTLYLFYTGAFHDGIGSRQVQCMASSEDGIHFQKYEGNPVVTPPPGCSVSDFRDPKVWAHEGMFYMICSGQKDGRAVFLLFTSPDLTHWEYFNVFLESFGELGPMWECPDFYELDGYDILTFSPIGLGERKAMYFVGHLNYRTGRFEPLTSGESDWGMEFYAAQSLLDPEGRRIITGWAGSWDWMPWWRNFGPTQPEGWCGFLNLPREVRLTKDCLLQFFPLDFFHQKCTVLCSEFSVKLENRTFWIPTGRNPCFHLKLSINLKQSTAKAFDILLRCDKTRATRVRVDLAHGELLFDRQEADGFSTGSKRCPLKLRDDFLLLDLFSDRSSIELFTDAYMTCMSCNIYPDITQTDNAIAVNRGLLVIQQLECWEIE